MFYKILILIAVFTIIFLSFHQTLAKAEVIKEIPVQYTDEFIRIGGCESVGDPYGKWDYHAKNPKGSASGVFEFINSSWYHYGRELWGEEFYSKNIWTKDNVELAWYVYKKYGTKDWLASKACWN